MPTATHHEREPADVGTRIRVLVADDHPMYLGALADAIVAAADLELADAVADGRTALQRLRTLRPDVAVLDVRMPILSGPVVARHVAEEHLPTRVLFLSAQVAGTDTYDALAGGGCGYVTKDATMGDIHRAIRRVAAGERVLGLTDGTPVPAVVPVAEPAELDLSQRERAVLDLIVTGMSVVAMGRHLHLSPSVVKATLASLYAKLGVNSRVDAVAQALRRGLVD